MTVTTPPHGPEIEEDRDLEQRVAELEALIEEARRRARRRRRIYAAIVLTALGAAVWASFDIGGNSGISSFARSPAGSPSGSASTASSPGRWVPTGGPEGGSVISLVVDPANPRVLYAGGSSDVFKSTDGGVTWRDVRHAGAQVTALAIDPTRPETVYAGTTRDVLKTVDGGRQWRKVDAGLGNAQLSSAQRLRWGPEHWLGALLVDPNRPRTVYALVAGGLFRTTNGGGRWRFERPRLGRFSFLSAAAVDPAHPGTVYASWTVRGYGGESNLYKTTNGGSSWQRIAVHSAKPSFASLVIDAGTPGTIFATDDSYPGIYTSIDGGTSWSVVTLPLQTADGLHVFPGSQGTLYATTNSGAVFTSTDAGATWHRTGTEASLGYGPLAVDLQNPDTVYGSGDGVAKSVDGGHTWTTNHKGLVNTSISSLVIAPERPATFYAGGYGGVFKSTDRGKTWRAASSGLEATTTVATLAVDPQHPQTIFAGDPWSGLGGAQSSGLFKSIDGGLTWSTVHTGLPENAVQAVAIDPQRPSTVYVGACKGRCGVWSGTLLKTVDSGATWRAITLPARGPVQSLAIDPRSSNTVFAGTSRGGLFRSRDGGTSWQRVAVAPGVQVAKSHLTLPYAFVAIAIDSRDPDNVYAGVRTGGILKSTDGGTTWAPADGHLTNRRISALAVDPRNPRVLFASTEGGVFRSSNGGESWQPYGHGQPRGVAAFAIDPRGRVYAATQGEGVLALEQER